MTLSCVAKTTAHCCLTPSTQLDQDTQHYAIKKGREDTIRASRVCGGLPLATLLVTVSFTDGEISALNNTYHHRG